jgi:P pilus assembly chaperone PapD
MHSLLLRVVASAAIALGLALCAAEGARASGFHFTPAIVQLTAHAHTGSVTITNPSDVPLRVEIQAFHWNQGPDGQALLDGTDQLLVFPQLIVIPPGASRQVRLAVLVPPVDREQTYQVSITEIPVVSTPASRAMAVTVRMRADIPVFFGPTVERDAGAIAATAVRNDALDFTVTNLGTVHFEAKNVHVSGLGPDMRELFAQDVGTQFVLAGSQRDYRIVLPRKECSALRALTISLDADAQHLSQTLDVPPSACGS